MIKCAFLLYIKPWTSPAWVLSRVLHCRCSSIASQPSGTQATCENRSTLQRGRASTPWIYCAGPTTYTSQPSNTVHAVRTPTD
jgi:hypothetical protein